MSRNGRNAEMADDSTTVTGNTFSSDTGTSTNANRNLIGGLRFEAPKSSGPDLGLTDDEAKQLLDSDDGDDDQQEKPEKGDTDWKAEAEKWRAMSRKTEGQAKEFKAKLKQFEDQGKTELERLTEDRDRNRSEAEKASANAKAMSAAIDNAPDWATPAIIKKVARRARGATDEELAEDVADLYEMAAPKTAAAPKTPGKPQERLKGGATPEEEVEETDGRKLAARIPRSSII